MRVTTSCARKIFVVVAMIISVNCFAQQQTATIIQQFINEKNATLEAVSVELLSGKGELVKAEISNKNGTVEFSAIKPGNYIITAGIIGYAPYKSTAFRFTADSNLVLPVIILSIKPAALKEVTVDSKKPFIEHQLDKIVLNVESSITSAGSSIMDMIS